MIAALPSDKIFYQHGFETILIIAILFTLIGFLIGRSLWRRCRVEAERIEALNEKLQEREASLISSHEELESFLEQLRETSAS